MQNHLLSKTLGDNVIIGIYIHKCIYFYATFPIWILPLSFHSTSEDVFDRKYEEWEFQGAGMQIFKLLVYLFILYFEPQTLQFLLFRNRLLQEFIPVMTLKLDKTEQPGLCEVIDSFAFWAALLFSVCVVLYCRL